MAAPNPTATGGASAPRPEKVAVVDEVRGRLSASSAAILTEYRGLKVHELAELRRAVRAAGGEYRIYKNTLVRLAVRELDLDGLDPLLTGPTAIAFVEGDAVVVAKALRDFARTHPNLTVKGGLLGEAVLTAADAGALAEVAPREVLLAQLAGGLAAPLRQMAGLLAALPRNLAYGLKALLEKQGGAPADAADAVAPTGAESAAADADDAQPATDAAEPATDAAEPATDAAEAVTDAAQPATDAGPGDAGEAPAADTTGGDAPAAPADAAADTTDEPPTA